VPVQKHLPPETECPEASTRRSAEGRCQRLGAQRPSTRRRRDCTGFSRCRSKPINQSQDEVGHVPGETSAATAPPLRPALPPSTAREPEAVNSAERAARGTSAAVCVTTIDTQPLPSKPSAVPDHPFIVQPQTHLCPLPQHIHIASIWTRVASRRLCRAAGRPVLRRWHAAAPTTSLAD